MLKILVFIFCTVSSTLNAYSLYVNNISISERDTLYLKTTDRYKIDSGVNTETEWSLILPVSHHYDNPITNYTGRYFHKDTIAYSINKIAHKSRFFDSQRNKDILPEIGTYYIGIGFSAGKNDIEECEPLHKKYNDIIQIVVRQEDTYIGYLTELLNTPFIMTPGITEKGFSQVDYRLGSNCACLAIYGKRRQGKRYEYCGPVEILKYLHYLHDDLIYYSKNDKCFIDINGKKVKITLTQDRIKKGIILDFLDQVTVVYNDAGIKGELDPEDLIIQSWLDGPYITKLADNGYFNKGFFLLDWENNNPEKSGE